jgi:ABC-type nitrate/sulfonate/bicarbonate transport system substrate-binding protein
MPSGLDIPELPRVKGRLQRYIAGPYKFAYSSSTSNYDATKSTVFRTEVMVVQFITWKRTGVFLGLVFFLFPVSAYPQALTKIQASYDGTAGFNLPIWILESSEIGKKYGFEINTFLTRGAQSAVGLIGGSFQYAQTGMLNAMTADAQGGDLVALGTSEFGFSYKFVARKGITDPKQLRGGTVGVAAYGGTNHLSVRLTLEKLGLSERDMTVIVAGNTAQRVQSLSIPGGMTATVLSPPSLFKAEKDGLPVLVDIREFGDYPNTSLVTTRSRIQSNPNEVRRFVRAWTEAIAFFKRRPTETHAILRKYLRLEDSEVVKATYDFFAEKLPRSPRISQKAFTLMSDGMKTFNPQIDKVTFEQVVDMRFVDEMEKDGFIAKLYR